MKPKTRNKKALERAHAEIGELNRQLEVIQVIANGERICVVCGCSDNNACPEGCEWSLVHAATPTGVCSSCVDAYLASMMKLLRRSAESPLPTKSPGGATTGA